MTTTQKTKPHFFDLTRDQLRLLIQSLNMPAFRTDQLLNWVYKRHITNPDQMTNLSKIDRRLIADNISFTLGKIIKHQTATDNTQKLLIHWPDQNDKTLQTECVLIPAENRDTNKQRRTACISTQVGCAVGCEFCASGATGLDADLTQGQIIEQIHHLASNSLSQSPSTHTNTPDSNPAPITNIVFMGMGEPLANLTNVIHAIQTFRADWAYNIAARRITVSTIGIPHQIRNLAKANLPITLAISLHAPNDDLRRRLIPWADHYSIADIITACRDYFDATHREITIEYILLHNTNDRPQHAHQLAALTSQLRANVNLILYNPVSNLPFKRPSMTHATRFRDILTSAKINTHIRPSRGQSISAACGQLRQQHSTSH